ncbi:MAG: RNA methyltransferase [Deltaproteobacteria bacterium]|nr:RNA methyltransferase [Deltaproteobacteria bacterium]
MPLAAEIHIALVHHPVINKEGTIVSTAVTNLDIHDNARSSRTYGVKSYHIVTPLDAQIELVSRILKHWRDGFGARRVPNRVEAMNLVHVNRTLEDAINAIKGEREERPVIISTCARKRDATLSFEKMRKRISRDTAPCLLVFGTGYGLAEEVFEMSDDVLDPIGDPGDWNHLSVRSAVAITLDRLLGRG